MIILLTYAREKSVSRWRCSLIGFIVIANRWSSMAVAAVGCGKLMYFFFSSELQYLRCNIAVILSQNRNSHPAIVRLVVVGQHKLTI